MLNKLKLRVRALFFKSKMEDELQAELRFHLEREIEENIVRGMTPEDARYTALRSFGGVERVKEESRDARGVRLLEEIWHDFRFGARMLLKQPGFTLIAVITLALGIGANTAIFSVVNAVLLNAVPYYEPQRLLWVTEAQDGRDFVFGAGVESYLNWQAQSQVFEHLVAFNRGRLDLTGRGEPERLEILSVTANVFPALGLAPQVGRAFTPEEERPEAARVALLGHAFWQRRFGGDPSVIGSALTLDGHSRTVIGIMPPRSRTLIGKSLEGVDVWLPLAVNAQQERDFSVIGRIKPGFTVEQAHAELNLIQRRLVLANPGRIMNTEARAILLSEKLAGNLRRGLLALFGSVALVLLIACANVANLLLGRAAMRQKEMAIRAALGAGRRRLVRQMLTESLLLSLLGGAMGLLLAVWGVKALVAGAPDDLHQIKESSVDGTALGFTFLATLLTGLAAGLIPALQSSQIDLNEALKEGARKVVVRRRWLGRVSPALVIGEVALTLVALTGAGLLVKSYLRALAVEPGFDQKNLLTLRVRGGEAQYPPGSPQTRAFYQEVLTRVKAIPGVKAVASATVGIPMTGALCRHLLTIEGRPPAPAEQRPQVECSEVSPDYIRALGMQLRAGRSLTEQDDEKAPPVVIINETMARRYFIGEDPIGKRIQDGRSWRTIVGVVGDVKRFGLEAETLPEVYWPYLQANHNPPNIYLAVRTTGDPLDSVAAVRQQIFATGDKLLISEVMTMEQRLAEPLAPRRFQMLLFGVFAAVALLLAAVGVYGVISYSVSRRTHEIGIRMALGAERRAVLRLIIGQGMKLATAGLAIGLIAAVAVTRLIKTLLFGVGANDPTTLCAVASLLAIFALLACYLPARRATKVDPLVALRCE
ncbi:MAG: ABC transporter permease [Blastocatellia bacterium]|nr:ABC transporter permease [Blastocatellia bacterium]